MSEYILADPISIRSRISFRVNRLGYWLIRVSEKIDDWPPWDEFSEFCTEAELKDWTKVKINLERPLTAHEIGIEIYVREMNARQDAKEKESFTNAQKCARVKSENKFEEGKRICGNSTTGWYPQR